MHAVSTPTSLLGLLVFLPLFGFIINGLTGRKLKNNKVVDLFALGTVGASFLISCVLFVKLMGMEEGVRSLHQSLWTWLAPGAAAVNGGVSHATIEWAYKFDPLSGAMALLVTGAGFLIHLFSTGYMGEERNDGRYYRFMAYMNLFVFSMLNLVLGANILMMFLGWEGVGLCSYLLIGFYFDKDFAAVAAKKAFVFNRVGDMGFMVGFFLLFMVAGSLDYDTLMGSFHGISALPSITLFGHTAAPAFWFNIIGVCLFLGACGKSAQIPLYVWLPDAMAGPTPVSALIHAATMVTSGLYMITRLNFVFVQAPLAMETVLVIGSLTAIFAASMGLAQYDIKKVLAYSTVSQLGYMFMGMGAGAFTAGMFHVFTHAFFKATLFLGSGAVIVACHHEQDMRNMGGLRKLMPITFASMMAATLAIAGIPPFSGFFSKDEILWRVFEQWYAGGTYAGSSLYLICWILGMLGAFMTAFYMMRLMVMTFFGDYRGAGNDPHHHAVAAEAHGHDDHHDDHGHDAHDDHGRGPKEVAWTMWLPVAILGALAVVGGFLNLPPSLGGSEHFSKWLEPLLYREPAAAVHATNVEYGLMIFSGLVWAPLAMFLAWRFYGADAAWSTPRAFVARFPRVFAWVHNKYFVDEGIDAAIVNPVVKGSIGLWKFDAGVIDGLVNLTAWLLRQGSGGLKRLQSGRVQNYAFLMFLGFLAIALWKYLA
ncbi:MAG TPA: NADH-quinone oxidoreductase subunit L [Holophagaceae bacterium]|nr:NADH-quinone oxidoreductase subunit L [Holophagaceae bacterium]